MLLEKSMKILTCIQKSPKSIKEISSETNIPIPTVYKMIHIFENHNMLVLTGEIATAKYMLFQSKGNFEMLHKKLYELFLT